MQIPILKKPQMSSRMNDHRLVAACAFNFPDAVAEMFESLSGLRGT